ncbi:nucleotide pyrophosphohydrolase [Vibrio parahaemolyticus]|uniref:nucleotide pyrophosphohydrolase n=1 Tax=Vibrio parahaemolyticus TaxID=670 RepID=UPI0035BFE556
MKLSELQSHIKEFDYAPEQSGHYFFFLKLIEEVGELSESIRNGKSGQPTLDELKGSIAEELLYYVCALANIHGVNLEKTHELKEVLNKVKYNR